MEIVDCVCVYMPFEDGAEKTEDFIDQLRCIELLVNDNPDCHIVLCGDFNVDFTRNWSHTALLSSFCDNVSMSPAHRHTEYSVDFTYNFDMSRYSTLDHFILSGILFDNCFQTVSVLHDADNMSDHEPVLLDLCLDLQYVSLTDKVHSPRPSWQKANAVQLSNYCGAVSENLSQLDLPTDAIACHNPGCCDASHYAALRWYVAGITWACDDACKNTIPVTRCKKRSGRIAGWSEHVKPLKEKSMFWHKLWLSCGRPRSGAVADCMRRNMSCISLCDS